MGLVAEALTARMPSCFAPFLCAGLGNHFDRRDKWQEGIASIAWGGAHGEVDQDGDARGDMWTLRMQCGPRGRRSATRR